jgi:hypothetical protein
MSFRQISNILDGGDNWLLVLKLLSKVWSKISVIWGDFRLQGSVG